MGRDKDVYADADLHDFGDLYHLCWTAIGSRRDQLPHNRSAATFHLFDSIAVLGPRDAAIRRLLRLWAHLGRQ